MRVMKGKKEDASAEKPNSWAWVSEKEGRERRIFSVLRGGGLLLKKPPSQEKKHSFLPFTNRQHLPQKGGFWRKKKTCSYTLSGKPIQSITKRTAALCDGKRRPSFLPGK